MPSGPHQDCNPQRRRAALADRGFADVTCANTSSPPPSNLAAREVYHLSAQGRVDRRVIRHPQLATNRERLNELKSAEEAGGRPRRHRHILPRPGPTPRLRGVDPPRPRKRSAAARFMIRAPIESVPPIRRIKNRENRSFGGNRRRDAPFPARRRRKSSSIGAAIRARHWRNQTIRDSERLNNLSEGSCDPHDVDGIVEADRWRCRCWR